MIRLRPILMVSAATIAGHFPLTLVTGAGAAARNSIGLVLVGGMFIGTLFTLFVIPSIYMLIARDHGRTGWVMAHFRQRKPEFPGMDTEVPGPGDGTAPWINGMLDPCCLSPLPPRICSRIYAGYPKTHR